MNDADRTFSFERRISRLESRVDNLESELRAHRKLDGAHGRSERGPTREIIRDITIKDPDGKGFNHGNTR